MIRSIEEKDLEVCVEICTLNFKVEGYETTYFKLSADLFELIFTYFCL